MSKHTGLEDFDWIEAEKRGIVVVNAPARKIAVFNETSLVVVAVQEGTTTGLVTLNHGSETAEFCRHLLNASKVAEDWHESEMAAYEAIERLTGEA